MGEIGVERIEEGHLHGVAQVLGKQEAWWREADGRLRGSRELDRVVTELEGMLEDPEMFGVVALDGGEVLGGAAVWIRELPPDSDALAIMGLRDGMVKMLALPQPTDAHYDEVADALFSAIETWWDEQESTGANLVRPVCDERLANLLEARGWWSKFLTALRPAGPLPHGSRPAAEELIVRFAAQRDVEAVVALHLEEYGFHVALDPNIRMVPSQETEIRDLLAKSFAEDEDTDELERKRMFVVEYEGEVVATTIGFLYEVTEETPGVLALGQYCHIGSTGVRADMRGKGVGRALVEGVTRFFEQMDVKAYSLWYHTDNPLSSVFWPRLGWVGVSRRWRRRG